MPPNYKIARALVTRYLAASYRLDPMPLTEAAIANEQSLAIEIGRNCPVTCHVTYCARTGQPLGYMHNARRSTHLPTSVSPQWMVTGPQAIDRLTDEQPIAALIYALMALVFPGDSFADQWPQEDGEADAVTRYAARNALTRNLFTGLIDAKASHIAKAAAFLSEFDALTLDSTKPLAALQLSLRQVATGDLSAIAALDDLIAVITDRYAITIARAKSKFHIDGALVLDDEALVDQVQQWLTIAAHRREAQRRNEITTARAKHEAAVKQDTERKRSSAQRKAARDAERFREQFGDSLINFFDNAFSDAPDDEAPVSDEAVKASIDRAAGTTNAPQRFFNVFAAVKASDNTRASDAK